MVAACRAVATQRKLAKVNKVTFNEQIKASKSSCLGFLTFAQYSSSSSWVVVDCLFACLESLPCLDLSSAANQYGLILDDICGFVECN